jgi:hypothetical protein
VDAADALGRHAVSAETDRFLAERAVQQAAEHAERFALMRHNRRLFAERLHWADGVLAACERLDEEFPDWVALWRPANPYPGFERPAGYVITNGDRTRWAATLEELASSLRSLPG